MQQHPFTSQDILNLKYTTQNSTVDQSYSRSAHFCNRNYTYLIEMSALRVVSFVLCLLQLTHGNTTLMSFYLLIISSTIFIQCIFLSGGIIQLNQNAHLQTAILPILPDATSMLNAVKELPKTKSALTVCCSTQKQHLSDSHATTLLKLSAQAELNPVR